jgi:iron complex outermembrane receptor protein
MARRDLFNARLMAGASLGLIGLMTAGAVHAQGDDRTAAPEVSAIVVTAPKGRAADVAPVKSSLLATEPQAIISRKNIEELAPRVGDYTTTAILAPSMTSSPNPNGPGSTDGAKLSMRGFKDGEFNVTYDGIAWGDANGPSHHANSFFPSSTIGGVVIDRGPGDATELGQANFGGQVNLFSLPFEDKLGVRQTATYASFNTWQSVTTLATGPIKPLHDANFVFNYMTYGTDGYLTYSPSRGENVFLKATLPVTDHFKVTGLYTWNSDSYHQGDSNAVASVAQTSVYGKRFALSNDPSLETYTDYNVTNKTTDFAYIRLDGDFGHGLTAQNTTYTYAYTNNTLSGFDDSQLPANESHLVIIHPPGTYPAAGSGYKTPKYQEYGLPGYLKLNQYRITGDILKFQEDLSFGTATVGAMYEQAATHRSKIDIDLVTGLFDYREKSTKNQPVGTTCAAQGYGVQPNGSCQVPLYINNQEYSGWRQYQVFAQFEWRPMEGLRITPGVKYVNFNLFVRAPDDAKILQPVYLSPTFTKVLPFLTVNYHVTPTWAVYAQYAQGFLVPDVSVFNVPKPSKNSIVPQESTNYQIGTVYSAGNLTFDGDLYYIDFKHKIQSITDLSGDTFTTNSGGATYTGAEAQVTYVLPHGVSVFANYSRNNAVAKDDAVNPLNNGSQLPGAPRWTAAAGLRSEFHGVLVPDGRLVMNLTDKWIGSQIVNGQSGSLGPAGVIKTYSDVDFSATYSWRNFSIEGQVLNLGGSRAITAAKGKTYVPGTTILSQSPVVGGKPNLNQFTYDIGRSFQVTLKAAF